MSRDCLPATSASQSLQTPDSSVTHKIWSMHANELVKIASRQLGLSPSGQSSRPANLMTFTKACCAPGVEWEGTPQGRVRKIAAVDGWLSVYLQEPKGTPSSAVILISDVFGYDSKNLKMLADAYAKEGYLAVVPDLLNNDPYSKSDYGQDKDKQDKLSAWLKKHPVKDEGVHKQLDSLFEALHNQYSISKLFVEGFCWGGNYALELAATEKIDAAVIAHGSMMEPGQVEAIRQPTAFLWAESDDPELLKRVREITDNKSDVPTLVKLYPGTKHGFGIRGTWDNTKAADDTSNSATTAAAQEAFADACGFISKYNSGSPSWVQKGGSAALVAGVAALAIFAVKAWQSKGQ